MILFASSACNSHSRDARAEEARALLARIAALDPKASFERRAAQLEHLRELDLIDRQLARVRDACAKAHSGLLSAEAEQALVRERLARVGDGGLPPAELEDMQALVAQAAERLRASQGALPECEEQTRALLTRYR